MIFDSLTTVLSLVINSSVWRFSKETRLVWITLLAKKDKLGFVYSSIWALSRDACVTEEECATALEALSRIDDSSEFSDYEGRRIKPVEGGWLVLNGKAYDDAIKTMNRRNYQAKKQQEYRNRKKKPLNASPRVAEEYDISNDFHESPVPYQANPPPTVPVVPVVPNPNPANP